MGDATVRPLYAGAIVIGALHWAWEAVETLGREHEVGIATLMLAAAIGAIALGLSDEALAIRVCGSGRGAGIAKGGAETALAAHGQPDAPRFEPGEPVVYF